MRPDDPNNRRVGTPLIPQRSLLHTSGTEERNSLGHVAATAEIARSQLNSIYSGNTKTPTPQTTPVAQESNEQVANQEVLEDENPYERTQTNPTEIQTDQWKQYHSAWQDYYQKYYERYYLGQVYKARQVLETRVSEASKNRGKDEPTSTMKPLEVIPDEVPTLSRDEAMYDLRSKLVGQIQTSAKKVRKSRHFVPLAAALCVVLLFLFLQYNRVLFANVQAYISPGSIDPANIIIDPSTDIAVSPDPKLIIPKINVDVPVNYDAKPDYDSQMKAMETGVAYFGIPGANSKPGQIGNTVISGHSSNDVIDQGDYKFIFARLDHLENGDTIFVNYEGKRYSYTVTRKEVVKPTQVDKLVYATDKPILTLITCTPLGTSLNRLLITAEQVSPSPSSATAAPATTGSTGSTSIPGNSPTFVQRIFGGGDN
ncbi:MAG: sortase family protein [Candidatus Saccharibacteria bacterium]|nr:sortase family protein [Candidatus Saccharibacteria bacterium]